MPLLFIGLTFNISSFASQVQERSLPVDYFHSTITFIENKAISFVFYKRSLLPI